MAPSIWNKLGHLKTETNRTTFLRKIKDLFLNSYDENEICRDMNCYQCRNRLIS
jgi:hypothetical protein